MFATVGTSRILDFARGGSTGLGKLCFLEWDQHPVCKKHLSTWNSYGNLHSDTFQTCNVKHSDFRLTLSFHHQIVASRSLHSF